MTAIDVLYDEAAQAKLIIGHPAMTNDSYLAFARGLFKKERGGERRGDRAFTTGQYDLDGIFLPRTLTYP
jgi:hypothetical protein